MIKYDGCDRPDAKIVRPAPTISTGAATAKTRTVRLESLNHRGTLLHLDKIQAGYSITAVDLLRNGSDAATLEIQTKLAGMLAWHLLESKALKIKHVRDEASNTVNITAELGIFSS